MERGFTIQRSKNSATRVGPTRYDIIVIGGGSAGFSVLSQLEGKKLKVALVENRKLGGSCPNFACVPTKALVKCASVLNTLNHADHFGAFCKRVGFDWATVQKYRASRVSMTAAQTAEKDLKEKGVDLIWGTASFVTPHEIKVGNRIYSADQFAIATGSRERLPNVVGSQSIGLLNSDEIVEIRRLPESLAILGGGPVGIELGQVFARFGVKVFVLHKLPEILNREEPEVAELARRHLSKDGVHFVLNAELQSFSQKGQSKQIHLRQKGKKKMIATDQILTAIGRSANIGALNLRSANVKLTEKGIQTNGYLQTTQSHIYAAGDVAGNMLFTHVASYEGEIIGRNLLGKKIRATHEIIPRGTFCDPEIGSVGITEKNARKRNHKILTAILPYGGGRGFIHDDPEGLIKVIVDKKRRAILGASVIGRGAAEFIHLLTIAMHASLTVDDLGRMVYAFPTYAEAVGGIVSVLK